MPILWHNRTQGRMPLGKGRHNNSLIVLGQSHSRAAQPWHPPCAAH